MEKVKRWIDITLVNHYGVWGHPTRQCHTIGCERGDELIARRHTMIGVDNEEDMQGHVFLIEGYRVLACAVPVKSQYDS